MRMMMLVKFPNEDFNDAVIEGEAQAKIDGILQSASPECCYFTELDGQRALMMIVNIDDASQIPSYSSPWFLAFDAEVEFKVAITPEELREAKLGKLGKKWG